MSTIESRRDYAELEAQDPLALDKETIQDLDVSPGDAEQVKGGWIRPPISWSCPEQAPRPTAA